GRRAGGGLRGRNGHRRGAKSGHGPGRQQRQRAELGLSRDALQRSARGIGQGRRRQRVGRRANRARQPVERQNKAAQQQKDQVQAVGDGERGFGPQAASHQEPQTREGCAAKNQGGAGFDVRPGG